ncbi:hypothetical protein [Leifsonia sp. 22587]|uniref:hypothetical protein n=1 Tax=Leifsonia sp. 22587 TaxID=3453946 RepID=UPI003F840701
MTDDYELVWQEGDDAGDFALVDPVQASADVDNLTALLITGGFADHHNLAGEALDALYLATSPAYMRLVALAVMERISAHLLLQITFLEFPAVFSRINKFVMTYRRLRPDWEAEQLMGRDA